MEISKPFFLPGSGQTRVSDMELTSIGMDKSKVAGDQLDSHLIDQRIAELTDWRGEVLGLMRKLIHDAAPAVVEEVKWRKPTNLLGVPVWSHDGIICTGEVYQDKVKLTFAQGATLADPDKLFNASLEGSTRRAIDIPEGQKIDSRAFMALVRAAVDHNVTLAKGKKQRTK